MYAFNYERPANLAAAQALLAAGGNALAGGQTMIAAMKQRLQQPETVVDLGGISSLTGIRKEGNAIVIGAMTRHQDVASNALVRQHLPGLAALANGIGDKQIRAMGTLGGSVANNDPAACYPSAVLALGVLSKYTMSAVLASWVVWWWLGHRSVAVSKGMALAAGLAVLALLPHLAWNHDHDWPTLKHTADLLSGGSASSGSFFAKLLPRLAEYLGSQALLAGPVFLLVSVLVVMRRWIKPASPPLNFSARPALWAWYGSWPLWAIGGLQAMQGTAQINWPAPALLGASLALGWLLGSRAAPWRWRG